jgi:hypothetical protein
MLSKPGAFSFACMLYSVQYAFAKATLSFFVRANASVDSG